jgi:hypothetical protein
MSERQDLVRTLRDPDTWESVAAAIGDHPYTYDLDDTSHRMDVVQIVCEAAAFHLSGKGL